MKIKSLLAWGMASCMAVGMSGCFLISSSDSDEKIIEMYPVKVSSSAWSFVDKDGKILYEDEFKHCPTPVIDGHFVVEESDTYTFYEAGKKPKAVLEGLKSAGYFYDGVIPAVMPKERIKLYNGNGKEVATIEPVSGKEITRISAGASDGMFLIANEDNEMGYANTKGNVVIPPKYLSGSAFSEGHAWVAKDKGDNEMSYFVIDKKGKEVGKLKNGWTPESPFINGRMLVSDEDGRYGFANTKGEIENRFPEKVEGVANFDDDYMIYSFDGSFGLWKIGADQPEIKAKYDGLAFYNDKYLLAYNDDRIFLVDYSGEKKVEFDDYKTVWVLFGKGFELAAREGSHYILIDADGKPIGKEEFKDILTYVDFHDWIYSDYFNVDGMVNRLVADFTKDGYGKYTLGQSATSLNLDADDYKWTSKMSLDDMEGYRYNIQPTVYFNRNIAEYSYDYYYNYSYYIDPNARINQIHLAVNAQTDIWDDARVKIIDAFKDKGFKVKEKGDNGATIMTQGTTYLYIVGEGSGLGVGITDQPLEFNNGNLTIAAAPAVEEVAEEVVEADYDEYYD